MTAAVLHSLEERFGPSDADREEWLAARRQGITATEVRDLWLGRLTQRALARRKLGLDDEVGDLSYIPVIKWGRDREPIIAEVVQERYGIAPESRVIRDAVNPRFLASPDGIGSDFGGTLSVSEIKTSWKDLSPAGEYFAKTGYLVQMLWQMHVVGAERCLFAHEVRLGDEEVGFTPGDLRFDWFAIDDHETLRIELVRLATSFLEYLDAYDPDAESAEIDDELDTLGFNYLRFLREEGEAKRAKEESYSAIRARVEATGGEFRQQSPIVRITYKPGDDIESDIADVEAAKAADPALFAEVQALSKRWNEHQAKFRKVERKAGRASLRITPVKAER